MIAEDMTFVDISVVDDNESSDLLIELLRNEDEGVKDKVRFRNHVAIESEKEFYEIDVLNFDQISVWIVDLKFGESGYAGIKMIEKIRKELPLSCIIAFSAHMRDTKLRNRCIGAGANFTVARVGYDLAKDIKNLLAHVFSYVDQVKSFRQELIKISGAAANARDDSFIEVIKNDNKLVVSEIDNEKVVLRLLSSNVERELEFDAERIDSPEKLQVHNIYRMYDVVIKYGVSEIRFELVGNLKDEYRSHYEEMRAANANNTDYYNI